jgi:outer membrane cobalamin receptor
LRGKILRASIYGHYISDYYGADHSEKHLPAYLLANVRFIFKINRHLELFLDMNNILDTDYLVFGDFPGLTPGSYQMPGRNAHLGLHMTY